MPSNGQQSFLPWKATDTRTPFAGCQCPPTGNSHFYIHYEWYNVLVRDGVNALQRATVISTTLTMEKKYEFTGCQCPPTGNSHFYEVRLYQRRHHHGVSMPSNGQQSFLPYPSKFVDFMRLPSLIFRGIFLNILITADFLLRFWLFTICSYFRPEF